MHAPSIINHISTLQSSVWLLMLVSLSATKGSALNLPDDLQSVISSLATLQRHLLANQ